MRKTLLLALLLVFTCVQVQADPVSLQKARSQAAAFLLQQGLTLAQADAPSVHQGVRRSGKFAMHPAYYVFNAADNAGFVVVSGDDRTAPILAHTQRGAYDAARLPQNLKSWFEACEEYITHLDANNQLATRSSVERQAVAPLMSTQWDQGAPYNAACPTYNGEPTLTGCTATALAQVMCYTRWPEGDCTPIPAYTSSSYRIKMPELPAVTFNWDAMTNNASDEVARLMLYAGQSVKSDYTVNATAGSFTMIPEALMQHYGYDKNVRYLARSNYSIDEWDEILYTELAAGRPVLYSGFTVSVGHAFVCDGYDGNGLYHINWGWSGMYDGYYEISVLRPGLGGSGGSTTNDGYTMTQGAIVGIQSPTEEAKLPLRLIASNFRSEGTKVHCNYDNYNAETIHCYIGYAHLNDDASLELLNSYQNQVSLGPAQDGYVRRMSYSYDLGTANLAAGEYKVVPVCRESNQTEWQRISALNNYVLATISADGSVSLVQHPVIQLQADNIVFTGNKVEGMVQDLSVDLQNVGEEVNTMIYVFASKTSTKGRYAGGTQIALAEGAKGTAYLNFLPSAAGTYNVWICTDEAGKNVIATTTVDIAAAPTTKAKLTMKSMQVSTTDGAKITVKFTNAGTETYLRPIWIGLQYGGSWTHYREVLVPTEPGEEGVAEVEFFGLQSRKTYAAYAYYYPNFTDNTFELLGGPKKFITPQATSIESVETDDNANAPCYTLQGIRVERPTAPGVYVRGGKKIIVK